MLSVSEHLVLSRQIGPTGIDQVNTGQTILFGDCLRPEMFFDCNRVVGAALDGGVVDHQHAVPTMNLSYARDDATAGDVVIVEVPTGQLGEFKKPGTGIQQSFNTFPGKQFAPGTVPFPSFFATTLRDSFYHLRQCSSLCQHEIAVGQKVRRSRINAAGEFAHEFCTAPYQPPRDSHWSTWSSRSAPQKDSESTMIKGDPKTPRARASSFTARSFCLIGSV